MLLGAHALPCTAAQKVIVVVANRLALSDIDNPLLPTLSRMIRGGSVGLISPNCAGPKSEYSVMLTASAGVGCKGGASVAECYDVGEKLIDGEGYAADVFKTRTGADSGKNSAVFLGLGPANRINIESGSPIQLCALGEALHHAGKKTAVVGNADIYPGIIDRSAGVLAVDSRGIADYSRISCSESSAGSYGMSKPDAESLIAAASSSLDKADYSVVYYGGTTRLDKYRTSISDTAYTSHRLSVLKGLDGFLQHLISTPAARGAKIVLVSFCPPLDGNWDQLTPIVIYPSAKSGLLVSPTTRTPGLIAASDFAPTVLGLMDIKPADGMIGRQAVNQPLRDKLPVLHDLDVRVTALKTLVAPVLWVITIIGAFSFTGTALVLAFSLKVRRSFLVALRISLLAIAVCQLTMLLSVLLPAKALYYGIGTFGGFVVLVPLIYAASALLKRRFNYRALPVLIAYVLTVTAIIIDAFTGGGLCKFSVPSCFQLSGMRYYGIGNEYAGGLIGMMAAICLFISGLGRKEPEESSRASYLIRGTWIVLALGAATVITLGASNVGANYGATIAAVVTFMLIGISLWRGNYGFRHVAAAFTVGTVLVVVLALLDAKLQGAVGSHAGRATSMAEKLGMGYVLSMVSRKVLLNLSIFVSHTSQRVIFAFIPFFAAWIYGASGRLRQMMGKKRAYVGIKGFFLGVAAAFLFNDSGIVIAGIMVAMILVILLYSLLEEYEATGLSIKDAQKEGIECREL